MKKNISLLNFKNIPATMSNEKILNGNQAELWTLVKEINAAWRQDESARLADYFHDDVIFNSPDFKHQIKGKTNCVETYIDFMKVSKVLLYRQTHPKVHLSDNTAVVTYCFEMKYEQNSQIHHETGIDVFVFSKSANGWKVIWRGMSNLKVLGGK